jgi:hypothetical protein
MYIHALFELVHGENVVVSKFGDFGRETCFPGNAVCEVESEVP